MTQEHAPTAGAVADHEWLAAHEGHDVQELVTVAYCATCDATHTTERPGWLGWSR